MNAFLTGSQVYGTPHEKSDIDLVVLVSQPELEILAAHHRSDSDPEVYKGMTSTALRFGKLNLLCVTNEADFAVWRSGTDDLAARKPVTRPEAIALFTAKRAELKAKRDAENAALDAIIAECMSRDVIDSCDEKIVPLDDPQILTDEDHVALAALGDDLVDRLVAKESERLESNPLDF